MGERCGEKGDEGQRFLVLLHSVWLRCSAEMEGQLFRCPDYLVALAALLPCPDSYPVSSLLSEPWLPPSPS